MLSNAYSLAKIRFDTAENERHFAENLPKTDDEAAILGSEAALGAEGGHRERVREDVARALAGLRGEALCRRGCVRALIVAGLGKLANFATFLAGSFSAVSKRNFARKYAFDSIFQDLQDLHPFAPLQSQNFRKKSV